MIARRDADNRMVASESHGDLQIQGALRGRSGTSRQEILWHEYNLLQRPHERRRGVEPRCRLECSRGAQHRRLIEVVAHEVQS